MSTLLIDAFDFCRQKEQRSGKFAVADLPRLAAETDDRSGELEWSVEGGADQVGHPQLSVTVTGVVRLRCQRCLTPMSYSIHSVSAIVLAADEASADAIEKLLNDDEIDVIVGSRNLSIATLIEDESLLALPISPRHDTCPDQEMVDAIKKSEKESPFAVLKNLKR